MYLGNPHPGYQRHETPQWFPYRTGQKEENDADKHWPPKYVSYDEIMETIIVSYWSEQPTNLSAFRNRVLSNEQEFSGVFQKFTGFSTDGY